MMLFRKALQNPRNRTALLSYRSMISIQQRSFASVETPQALDSHCCRRWAVATTVLSSSQVSVSRPSLLRTGCRTFAKSSSSVSSSSSDGIPFLLADIGEGIKEVELLQWFVQPGDQLQQFDKVCEVQSDKATVEITSRYDGTVSHLCGQVGDMMQVGQPLLLLVGQPSAGMPTNGKSLEENDSDTQRLSIPSVASHFHLKSDDDNDDDDDEVHHGLHGSAVSGKFHASPAVRKLGAEYKIDLNTLHGSGPHGRLLKTDVITYLKEQGKWKGEPDPSSSWAPAVSEAPPLRIQSPGAEKETPTSSGSIVSIGTDQVSGDEIVQLRGYNRLMVKSMTASLQIPHMGFADEIIVNKLIEARKQLADYVCTTQSPDIKLSLLVFLVKACSLALLEQPLLNAVVHDAESCQLRLQRDHHIGIAMDTPRGLVVPVLRSVQTKSLLELQYDLDVLKEKAMQGKLTPDDITGVTFTLSNIGSIGGTYMQPVITSPQLAMGALGKIQRLPRFVNNNSMDIFEARIMNVSWSGDHRWLDGALLARFSSTFKRYVEDPVFMLARLK